jgi:hypothetical protein
MRGFDTTVVDGRGQTAFFAAEALLIARIVSGEKGSQSPSLRC